MIDIVNILNNDGVIVLPTDTIVGFSCKVDSDMGCKHIQDLKKRDGKPFIVLDSSFERVVKYFKEDSNFLIFLHFLIDEKIWPNNLTLIYDKNPDLNYSFLDDFSTIAVRFTDNDLIKEITNQLDCGIVSTSINISGEKEMRDFNSVFDLFGSKVDYIYPFESIAQNIASSTIIQFFSESSSIKVLREGNQLICNKLKKYLI